MSYASLGGIESDSKNYEEKGLVGKKDFIFEKKIKTNKNESFVKVAGQNLYFLEEDIIMLNSNSSNTTANQSPTQPCVRLCK